MILSLLSVIITDQFLFVASSMDVDEDLVREQNVIDVEEDGNADAMSVMSEEVPWQGRHAQDSEGPEVGKYLILLFCSLFY